MRWLRWVFWMGIAALLASAWGCGEAGEDEAGSTWAGARRVELRNELVGGPRALGEVGDFLLENDQVRAVIQAPGFSRGFGIYGGSLIDLDLRRAREAGNSAGGSGRDALGELFPAFFLQAVRVDTVEVIADGRDGGTAIVRASGDGGDFLTLVDNVNRLITGSFGGRNLTERQLRFEIDYALAPGSRTVQVTFRVINLTDAPIVLPPRSFAGLLNQAGIRCVPVGDVALFGALSSLFAPGVGFDVRFGLERSFAIDFPGNVFPGLVTEWMATRSAAGVSYGYFSAGNERNLLYQNREIYEAGLGRPVTPSSMIIPFTASGFVGVFYDCAPPRLEPAGSLDEDNRPTDRFESVKYVAVGTGDVASALDEMLRFQGAAQGRVAGMVFDQVSGQPAVDVNVLVYQRQGDDLRIYSQFSVGESGSFAGALPPGSYSLRIQGPGRHLSDATPVEIAENELTSLRLVAPSPGRVVVHFLNPEGVRLPAKVTAVGRYAPEFANLPTTSFLFDLETGDSFRYTDLVPDDPNDPDTLRFIEGTAYAHRGVAVLRVRPGTYDFVSTRGLGYDFAETRGVDVRPGDTVTLTHVLRPVIPNSGWLHADLHLHSQNSIDSAESLDNRVRGVAAEGLQWAVATDHNFLTDYAPYLASNDLLDWVRGSVGLELTTLEAGHFNGFPLRLDLTDITRGMFQWSSRPPAEIFEELRSRGRYGPENTIIQVNHPRDSILGYFNQYRRSGVTADFFPPTQIPGIGPVTPSGPAFYRYDEDGTTAFTAERTLYADNFDAIELINGKRLDQLRHYRMPDVPPEILDRLPQSIRNRLPEAGAVLVERPGQPEPRVAFPGAIDDWFNLLNLGYRYIGVGNSDSHGPDTEPGTPRTLIWVGTSDVRQVSEMDFVRGLQSRRVIATNGPIIEFTIAGTPVGGDVRSDENTVQARLQIYAAPYVSVGRVNIIRNGLVYQTLQVDQDRNLMSQPLDETLTLTLEACEGPGVPLERCSEAGEPIDTWFVVEAIGYRSLFPLARPNEIPKIDLIDAVGSLGSILGLGGSEFGPFEPADLAPVTPYGLTNPIWVSYRRDDFQARGPQPAAAQLAPTNNPGLDQNPYNRPFRTLFEEVFDEVLEQRILGMEIPAPACDHDHDAPPSFRRVGPFLVPSVPGQRIYLRHGHVHVHTHPVQHTFLQRDPANPYDIRRIIEAFDHGHAH